MAEILAIIGIMTPAVSHVGETSSVGHLVKNAPQARRFSRKNRHRRPVARNGRAVDPCSPAFYTGIVYKVSDLEIVSAVDDKVASVDQALDIRPVHVGDYCFEIDGRVYFAYAGLCGNRLGKSFRSVGFLEKGLSLKVREF